MTRRYRHGLATYRPRTAATVAGEGQRARSRRPAVTRRSRSWPAPNTKAAHRLHQAALGARASWPAEARALAADALSDSLGRAAYEGSAELWREYLADNYRRIYNAQQKRRHAARPKRPGAWVRVRAHKRHRPGGRS